MERKKGLLGLGILPVEGPLRRRLNAAGGAEGGKTEEPKKKEDALAVLEESVNSLLEAFDKAAAKSECSLCHELLAKIKNLPLEEQAKAVPELRQFMKLAETGTEEEIKEGLKEMKNLMKVMEGD